MSIILPMAEAQAMWARAQQFDVEHGGRFAVRLGALILWSGPDQATGKPVGMAWIHVGAPTADQVELCRLAWDTAHGGSEADVWRALDLLAGCPLQPRKGQGA